MSILTYHDLVELVDAGAISGVEPENINGASIDITLGADLLVESADYAPPVDMARKKIPKMLGASCADGYILRPREFILGHSREVFALPDDIAAEFKLKSSLARAGLGHALAGWCDPGWHGSHLTLELFNSLRHHSLVLREGMKIGQIVFFRGKPVPSDRSYRSVGQYNGDRGAVASKGVR
jgi:dCTP deaminase